MTSIRVGGVYRHYKGKLYTVLTLAKDSETLTDMVVYRCLYTSKISQVWVRPVSMFLEEIDVDGVLIPRFQLQT